MAKKELRECDVRKDPHNLVKAFLTHCDYCEQGCPMGCIHRREDLERVLEPGSWQRGSVLQCFAQFALSKYVERGW